MKLDKNENNSQIHVHSSLDSLAKYISTDILPNECGGKAGSLMTLHEETTKSLEDNRAWFLYDQANNRVNESLRPAKGSDSLGVTASSSKKFEID